MSFDNEMRGVLFKNSSKRDGKLDPDYRGRIQIEGREFWLDAWRSTAKKDGSRYMQLRAKPKDSEQPQRPAPGSRQAPAGGADPLADIPF